MYKVYTVMCTYITDYLGFTQVPGCVIAATSVILQEKLYVNNKADIAGDISPPSPHRPRIVSRVLIANYQGSLGGQAIDFRW